MLLSLCAVSTGEAALPELNTTDEITISFLTWDDFELTRAYREGIYHIRVKNPDHVEKGIKKLVVDGTEVPGKVIPYHKGQKEYNVEVLMG